MQGGTGDIGSASRSMQLAKMSTNVTCCRGDTIAQLSWLRQGKQSLLDRIRQRKLLHNGKIAFCKFLLFQNYN